MLIAKFFFIPDIVTSKNKFSNLNIIISDFTYSTKKVGLYFALNFHKLNNSIRDNGFLCRAGLVLQGVSTF